MTVVGFSSAAMRFVGGGSIMEGVGMVAVVASAGAGWSPDRIKEVWDAVVGPSGISIASELVDFEKVGIPSFSSDDRHTAKLLPTYLYWITVDLHEKVYHKIGIAGNIKSRLGAYGYNAPFLTFQIASLALLPNRAAARKCEIAILGECADISLNGEWLCTTKDSNLQGATLPPLLSSNSTVDAAKEEHIATTIAEAIETLRHFGITISQRPFYNWMKFDDFPGKPGTPGLRDGHFPCSKIAKWARARALGRKIKHSNCDGFSS